MNLQAGQLSWVWGILPGCELTGESYLQKSRNWPYLTISLFLLVLATLGLVRQISVAELPPDFPWEEMAWPVTVRGVTLTNAEDLRFLVEGFQAGDSVDIDFPDGPRNIVTVASQSKFYLTIAVTSGLIFWLVAFLVFIPRLDMTAVTQFYWITMLYGLGIFLGGVYFEFGLKPVGMALNIAQLCNLAFLPVVFLHMTLIFPKRLLGRGRVRFLPGALYGLAVLLVIWQAAVFARYFNDPVPANAAALPRPQRVADLVMVTEALIAIVIMVGQARKLEPGRRRQQARWLLVGFVVGATPYVFLRTLPQLLSVAPPFPAHFDRLFEPAIPLAFVLAVVRYRFLDIDIILRRGILYGFLAAGMAGLILIPVGLMQPEKTREWSPFLQSLPVLCGVLAGFLFLPLRRWLGGLIDRVFFRIEHRVGGILEQLRRQMKTALSQDDVALLIHGRISEALNPSKCLVLVETVGGETRVGADRTRSRATAESCAGFPATLWAQPDMTTCPEQESIHYSDELSKEGFVIGLKLEAEGWPVGSVLLGPRRIGHRYVRSDLTFLTEAAQAASNRLQEIRLVQKVSEEKMKSVQLEDLASLKDDFLSQVAHDLRTPVTSVGWSLNNLLDGLAGDLQPRQREYLETMSSSLEHLNHLVSSLLEITRLEKAEVTIPVETTELAPILARAVGTVRPLAEAAEVNLRVADLMPGLSLVTNGDKLAEVLVNILENGVRYSEAEGELEITAEAHPPHVFVTVRDHGPGFAKVVDPFVRFAQGQPSPHGPGGGYGLGLTIARETTRLMGGEITARNHPAGGAEFTLVLPGPKPLKEM